MDRENQEPGIPKKRKYTKQGQKWVNIQKTGSRRELDDDEVTTVPASLFGLGKMGDERRKRKSSEERTTYEKERIENYKKYGKYVKKVSAVGTDCEGLNSTPEAVCNTSAEIRASAVDADLILPTLDDAVVASEEIAIVADPPLNVTDVVDPEDVDVDDLPPDSVVVVAEKIVDDDPLDSDADVVDDEPEFVPSIDKTKEVKFNAKLTIHELSPSMELMRTYTPVEYVTEIAENENNYHRGAGILKIITPVEYEARPSYDDVWGNRIHPKNQVFNMERGRKHAYKTYLSECPDMTVAEYKKMTEIWCPEPAPEINKEEYFWDPTRISRFRSVYGSDVDNGISLFTEKTWSLGEFNSLLKHAKPQNKGKDILGITKSYTYYGSWGTGFCMHREDMDTYSLNYLHDGASKYWYTTNIEDNDQVLAMLENVYTADFTDVDGYKGCPTAFRHKELMPSPKLFLDHGISYGLAEQKKGHFIVALPKGYHWGWNGGFNIAEALNFATKRWLDEVADQVDNCADDCWFYPQALRFDVEDIRARVFKEEKEIQIRKEKAKRDLKKLQQKQKAMMRKKMGVIHPNSFK